jgi:hypothetical protein
MTAAYISWRLGAGAGANEAQIADWTAKERGRIMDAWQTPDVADARRRSSKNGAPDPTIPPAKANTDPAKGPTHVGLAYRTMLQELPLYIAGQQARLSASTYDLLRQAKVDARDANAVKEYLNQQMQHVGADASLSNDDLVLPPPTP